MLKSNGKWQGKIQGMKMQIATYWNYNPLATESTALSSQDSAR
jgi:hypothetical protein